MTVRQQWMAVLGIVLVLGVGLWAGTHFIGDEFYDVRVGSEAPGFNAVDVASTDALPKSLSDYRGKVILLNIWATWCEPCREEMPTMEALHRDLEDEGLAIVAVSVDDPNAMPTIRQFVQEYGLTFDVLHDQSQLFRGVYRYFGVPETYVIDRKGVIRRKEIRYHDWNAPAQRDFIERLLAEPGA
jgi:peroxiredoxin